MAHLVTLSLSLMSNEIRKILSYRSDFWVTYFGQVAAQYFIAQALWQNIFEANKIDTLNNFTLIDFNFFYLLSPLLTKVLTGENIGFISRDIYEGSLNRYLIYPLSFFHYKWITYFSHSFIYFLQTCLLYMLWIIYFGFPFSEYFFSGVFILFLGTNCYFLLLSTLELISFWAENVWSLGVMIRFIVFFLGGGFIPFDFFPTILQDISSYLPFRSMVYLPIQLMMGRGDSLLISQGVKTLIIWNFLLIIVLMVTWKKGRKEYSGIGM